MKLDLLILAIAPVATIILAMSNIFIATDTIALRLLLLSITKRITASCTFNVRIGKSTPTVVLNKS